ncbi:hypothetical protein pb186bvf_009686 [Paramecium bursaria]
MISDNLSIDFLKEGGIPKNLLHHSIVDVEHLQCPICLNILWKPVACGQDRCFQSFCEVCINRWIAESNDQQPNRQILSEPVILQGALYSRSVIVPPPNRGLELQNDSIVREQYSQFSSSSSSSVAEPDWTSQQLMFEPSTNFFKQEANCPKCKRPFKKTSVPIIHNLLDAIQFSCIHEGCRIKPQYEQFQKHIINCPFRRLNCPGCKIIVVQSELEKHRENCQLVEIECPQCNLTMTRKNQLENHTNDQCFQQQLKNKDKQMMEMEQMIESLQQKNQLLESKIERLTKGDYQNIQNFTFKTSFSQNYQFSVAQFCEAKLVRASYNIQKQKNDFLHFYVNHKIKTQSIQGVQWRIKIQTLQGNLLLGICSTLCHYSIDFIMNRLGETKKKEWNENKYKQLRKVNFTFGEGDTLSFQFMPLSQCLRITNETRHQVCRFESTEIIEMGESFYSFFSLEFQGDSLIFL